MNKRKLWTLIAAPGLAVAGLLLAFLLLSQITITVDAASGEVDSGSDRLSLLNADMGGCSRVWVIETVDSDGDVGYYTSLALDSNNNPHISYFNETNDDLKYAWFSGTTWVSETVDSKEDVGRGTSLALDGNNNPHISYYDATNGDVKYAWLSGTTWVSETVDNAGIIDYRTTSLALVPTYPYTPHISYRQVLTSEAPRFLRHAWLDEPTWISETVNSGGDWTSLALVPTYPYTPCVSNHDFWGWALRYACRDGITWTIRHLEGKRAGMGGTSLALAPTYPYTPHISYYLPFGSYDLIHAYLSGTVWMSDTWVHETVDSDGNVGTDNSLALDQGGNPHISYRQVLTSGGPSRLKHAWLSGSTWYSETVDSGGDVGYYTSLALDQAGCPHISYYDATNGDLKYAYMPPLIYYLPVIFKNY
jgi:hypothetical protein